MIPISPAIATAVAAESHKTMGTSPNKDGATVGAFSAPTSSNPTASKPTTTALKVSSTGNVTPSSEPARPIPNVKWGKPTLMVDGKTKGERVVVTYFLDGDSVTFTNSKGKDVECRIDSYDSAEVAKPSMGLPGQKGGQEALGKLKSLIENKEVSIRVVKEAKEGENYNRATCQIEFEGKNIDREMVASGSGMALTRFVLRPDLVQAQAEAKAAKRGIYANGNIPIEPYIFRRDVWQPIIAARKAANKQNK